MLRVEQQNGIPVLVVNGEVVRPAEPITHDDRGFVTVEISEPRECQFAIPFAHPAAESILSFRTIEDVDSPTKLKITFAEPVADAGPLERVTVFRNGNDEIQLEGEISVDLGATGFVNRGHEFAAFLANDPDIVISWIMMDSNSVEITIEPRTAITTLAAWHTLARRGADTALHRVRNSPAPDAAVSVTFEFPPSVKSACEQYLLHFGDFLRDLGIDATVRLQEIGGHVLFAVAPLDRREALAKIQTALNVYLECSAAALVNDPVSHADQIIAYKLRANISHLQGQIELARAQNAVLQEHIDAQRLTIHLLRTQHSCSDTSDDASRDNAELERINRYVQVAPFEHGPLRIDLPQLLRDLRSLFRRGIGGA